MDSFNPKPSQEKKEEEFVQNLFYVSEEEQKTLKDKIAKNGGIIRIMIHPYYVQRTSQYEKRHSVPNQRIDIVEKGFEKILKTNSLTLFYFLKRMTVLKIQQKNYYQY